MRSTIKKFPENLEWKKRRGLPLQRVERASKKVQGTQKKRDILITIQGLPRKRRGDRGGNERLVVLRKRKT